MSVYAHVFKREKEHELAWVGHREGLGGVGGGKEYDQATLYETS